MKTRRRFFRKLGTLGAATALAPALNACAPAPGEKGEFMHVVFFWLVDKSPETRQNFEAELRPFIEEVEEIKSRHIGTPANTDREVIDRSWDYSLILGFGSPEDQEIYQAHPLHLKFIENASMLWEKVVVYDSVKS